MSSTIPPVGDVQGTARVQYVLPSQPTDYVPQQVKAGGDSFGPAFEVTLSKDARAALKAKEAIGDGQ